MVHSIRIDGYAYIWMALGILCLPFSWLIAAVLAALCHEGCHFFAAKILNVHISNISIGIGGMVMEMEPMPRGKEFAVALAGPLGSFLLCLMLRVFPELAICGLVQGGFNLLPIFPLDGGRLMYCILGKWAVFVENLFVCALLLMSVLLENGYGIYPFLFVLLITAKAIQRKFPCKELNLAVQ